MKLWSLGVEGVFDAHTRQDHEEVRFITDFGFLHELAFACSILSLQSHA